MLTLVDALTKSSPVNCNPLLNVVDSEFGTDEFGISVHSDKHDLANQLKIAACESLNHCTKPDGRYEVYDACHNVGTENKGSPVLQLLSPVIEVSIE